MRKLICLLMLVVLAETVRAQESCTVEIRPLQGVYRTYCPVGTVVTANGTRVTHVGNSFFVDDQLKCAELKIVCEEKVDKEEDIY